MYDYLIVGSGLFGAVFGQQMQQAGRKCLLIDRRKHFGGNVFTEDQNDICVHIYGPHLFHTNDKRIWDYVCKFVEFNSYQHRVKANYKGKIYSLPFNMNTFYELWGTTTPEQAKREIERQRIKIDNPSNLEEWALSQVGPDVYHTLIEHYTTKQWDRNPKNLSASIIKRLPLRFTYNDNYFNDRYQGVPTKGYTHLVENIIDGMDIKLNADFKDISDWRKLARNLVYTGAIDEYFDYCYGPLEYRSLRFENEVVDGDYQGTGQVNYTDSDTPYTRIVEHKHFRFTQCNKSVITREYPQEWKLGLERYYPINDKKNNALYQQYAKKAQQEEDVIIGGRLGSFKYFDMHQTIGAAVAKSRSITQLT